MSFDLENPATASLFNPPALAALPPPQEPAAYGGSYLPPQLWPEPEHEELSQALLGLSAEEILQELTASNEGRTDSVVQRLQGLLIRSQSKDLGELGDWALSKEGKKMPLLLKSGVDRFGTFYIEVLRSNGLLHPAHCYQYTTRSASGLKGARAPERLVHLPELMHLNSGGLDEPSRRFHGLRLVLALHAVNRYVQALREAFDVRYYDGALSWVPKKFGLKDESCVGLALVQTDISGIVEEHALSGATSPGLCREAQAWMTAACG